MSKNIIHNALENLDGYLISIKRNTDTGMYELEVGFRKNWVFKSTVDIKCNIDVESDGGTLVTISGKHDEITVDNLVEFVNRVIETNRKITEMQDAFEEELEQRKEEIANRILEIEDELEKVREESFEDREDREDRPKSNKKSKKTTEKTSEISIEDEKVAQKIS